MAAPTPKALLGIVLLMVAGCAPSSLLDRAIRARGGPLRSAVTRTQADVYVGVPGVWQSTRVFLAPNHYAWKIVTAADPIYELFDGTAVRSFIGTAEVSRDASPTAPLRSHARWIAVVNLDALHEPGVVVTSLAAADLPAGVREGLLVAFGDGARYRLGFDDRVLLVWAQGPIDLSPFGSGEITVRFAEYRWAGHLLLPFATSYAMGEIALANETALAICADPPGLAPASFESPSTLPDCP